MSSLADYLAKNYLNPDKKKSKKKKPKASKQEGSAVVIEGSSLGWQNDAPNSEEEAGDAPINIVSNKVIKTSKGFTRIDGSEITKKPKIELVGHGDHEEGNTKAMSSGALAGLQNADDVDDQIRQKQYEQIQLLSKQDTFLSGKEAETVYRDASGRQIDIAMKRAELKAKHEKELRNKLEREQQLNIGDIQKIERQEEEQKLKDARSMKFSRYASDEDFNRNLKEKERWEDPVLAFIGTKDRDMRSKTGRRVYNGMFPQNRFNVQPGIKWDGIDRSNGFEDMLLQKRDEVKEKNLPEEIYTVDQYEDFD